MKAQTQTVLSLNEAAGIQQASPKASRDIVHKAFEAIQFPSSKPRQKARIAGNEVILAM